ncbi:MAG: hypothetical protein ACYDHH_22875 [Solirubrobacteraceae bacterium]
MTLRSNGRNEADDLVEGEPSVRSRVTREAPRSDPPLTADRDAEQPAVEDVRFQLGRVADHIRGLHRELAELDRGRQEELLGPESFDVDQEEERIAGLADPVLDNPAPVWADADIRIGAESEAESLRAIAVAEARADAAAIRAEAERDAAELRAAAEEEARQLRAAATQTATELSAEIETLAGRLSAEIASVRADAQRVRAEVKEEAERVLAEANRESQELRRRMIAGARAEAERDATAVRTELAEGIRIAASSAITRVTRGHVQDVEDLMTSLAHEPTETDTVDEAIAELGLAASVLEQSIARMAAALSRGGADRASHSAD